ncbi:cyclic nucleotide-gated cation channel beta-1 [Caerostris extrusa]|uniref:Cyclic nucleotide-gated cation channel beta-1 n=1 Tax=Caerostris extrusa TaxID=172846 RepID=A0AAV4VV99_CAEEX|nr:cyclic nucleotide-gated cation channel beta-1 [Caerostris extrusa]
MSIEEKLQSLQSLSLPEESDGWRQNTRLSSPGKSRALCRHSSTERIWSRKLVQPPHAIPSPPLESSSDNDPISPIHQSRPRLQSLIEEEKSSIDSWSQTISFYCCSIRKKLIPTFPRIIDPQSKLYIIWLFFVMMSYAYNAWSIIFRAVFPYQTSDNIPIFLTFDYIADIIYLFDIALFKVRLQFLHNGFWVEDYKKTKANYFRKRDFKLDVLSLLPLDLLYFVYGINPLFRLPRFLKNHSHPDVHDVSYSSKCVRILRHVYLGRYIRCFYFATKTATSIGKNPKPENEIEYIFMTISWLMGVFIFAFLVGQSNAIPPANGSNRHVHEKFESSDDLQRRVRMWLNHNWEQQKTFNVGKILDTLPRKMKTDVAINVHYKTLVKVQLFKGEVGKEMYIVNKGIVEVLNGDKGDVLATLTKGSVFGEISNIYENSSNESQRTPKDSYEYGNIIKENEARAKAVRSRQESSSTTEDIRGRMI